MCRPREDSTIRFLPPTDPVLEQQQPVGERGRKMKASHKGFLLWHVLALAYYLSSSFCQCQRLTVDLSHPFDQDTLYWVTEPTLVLNVTYNGTLNDYWYQKEVFSAATHGGTHLDAPCHFAKGAWCVSDIPLPRLVARPAAVVDISSFVGDDPTIHLSPAHLSEWEEQHGPIPQGAVLLVRTGWSSRWPDPLAYTGSAHRKKEELKFPSISGSAAKWLVENRDVVGVGVDTMSVDPPGSAHPTTHVTLAERNIYGLENVNDLHLLPPVGATVYVMPMKLVGASGAPCRVFAETVTGSVASAFCANLGYIALAVLCVVLSCHY